MINTLFGKAVNEIKHVGLYMAALLKWIALAVITGALCGAAGSVFLIGVREVTDLRKMYPQFLFLIPAAGLLIVLIYKVLKVEGQGTNRIIDAVHSGDEISLKLIPAVFAATVLTHLTGGSAGREGAALQMGGTIGYNVGRLFRLDDRDIRTMTLAGMAAFFTALFGTPLAATVFAMMVISVGTIYDVAFIPCLAASLVSYKVSLIMGVEPVRFDIIVPDTEGIMIVKVIILALLCGIVSALFCKSMNFSEKFFEKIIHDPWLRAVLGGMLIITMTVIAGTNDYNGAGTDIIAMAIEEGKAAPEAFILKILFTAVTLSTGFKGGEVIPAFFIGAVFGCTAGNMLGIPQGFAAALGLVSVFCGAVNCPLASIFLSVEIFGDAGLIYFAIACGISYMISGYSGLYSSQTILYSKLKAKYINVHTNGYRAEGTKTGKGDDTGI